MSATTLVWDVVHRGLTVIVVAIDCMNEMSTNLDTSLHDSCHWRPRLFPFVSNPIKYGPLMNPWKVEGPEWLGGWGPRVETNVLLGFLSGVPYRIRGVVVDLCNNMLESQNFFCNLMRYDKRTRSLQSPLQSDQKPWRSLQESEVDQIKWQLFSRRLVQQLRSLVVFLPFFWSGRWNVANVSDFEWRAWDSNPCWNSVPVIMS